MTARNLRNQDNDEFRVLNARLISWGRWSQGGRQNLTLRKADPVPSTWDEDDAQLLEFTMTTWALTCRKGEMYTFTLKMHFAEGWGSEDDIRKDFRSKLGICVSRHQFYKVLSDAKRALDVILPDIGTRRTALEKPTKKWQNHADCYI